MIIPPLQTSNAYTLPPFGTKLLKKKKTVTPTSYFSGFHSLISWLKSYFCPTAFTKVPNSFYMPSPKDVFCNYQFP